MVHRILTALLEGRLEGATEKKLALAAQKAAVQSSQRELAATSAEREIEKRYLAEYMRGHVGEQFPAVVSGVTRFGLFAALENGIEGLIPVESLPDDTYHFDEGRMTLTGEHTRQSYTSGFVWR
jgi:ribonuclease R